MPDKEKWSKYFIWIGAGLLGLTVVLTILILSGVIRPNVFPPTGLPLDINPLASALLTFLLLLILLYVGTRVLNFGLKNGNDEANPQEKKSG